MLHPQDWSIERALQLYNIPNWAAGYFNISSKGHLVVHPYGQPGPVIDLMDVVDDIRERKLGFPCVVRFQDVLRSRVKQLNETFRTAIAQHGYKGQYYGVYPTKVNQMREVVEEILDAGAPYHFGLEAGSKGELIRRRSPSATATRTKSTCGSRFSGGSSAARSSSSSRSCRSCPSCSGWRTR